MWTRVEDIIWEQGKDYLVVGDLVVEENLVFAIESDVLMCKGEDGKT